ncbi:MAG: Rpn family recombination-promoting nuclease/putative transposase [Halanaerobiales bacterium]|nr:Rpn family recombination-promoting nuclease/putative transposase [Halanaerobiales bacterium]
MSSDKTENSIPHPHDAGYRHLLSSKKVFLELVRSFVKAGWVDNIDENSMIQMEGSFIAPDFHSKETDLIYRIKLKNQDVIFYLLMELQSTVDYFMPFRLLSYMMEIWRNILKDTPEEVSSRKDFRLPSIIPMVLYNGQNNWTATKNFKELLSGYEEFDNYVLNFSYFLFDVNRYEPEDLKNLSNMIGSIFLLDQKYDIMELDDRLKSITDVLQNMDTRQFQLFTHWFNNIICSNLSKENLDNIVKMIKKSSPEEVEKVISNLGETIKKAQEEAELRGMEKGIEQGTKKTQIEIAKNLLKSNIPIEIVAKNTQLSLEEVKQLAEEINNANKNNE